MRTAFVTCLLLLELMKDASPIPVIEKENYGGVLKKLEAREKRSLDFGWEDMCKRKKTRIANTGNYHSLNPLLSLRRHKTIGFWNI